MSTRHKGPLDVRSGAVGGSATACATGASGPGITFDGVGTCGSGG